MINIDCTLQKCSFYSINTEERSDGLENSGKKGKIKRDRDLTGKIREKTINWPS